MAEVAEGGAGICGIGAIDCKGIPLSVSTSWPSLLLSNWMMDWSTRGIMEAFWIWLLAIIEKEVSSLAYFFYSIDYK